MNIYVASSWRNALQPAVVALLRGVGHNVYDFRNPAPGSTGFNWREIDPAWQAWTPQQYREALNHPIAKAGFDCDMKALRMADACVLVLPSGRSASFEFGWAVGARKCGAVVMYEACEPELMYRGHPILTTPDELRAWAGRGAIAAWPVVAGYSCRQCGDPARANPGDGREWGCGRCNGSSHSLLLNFTRDADEGRS